MMTDSMIDIVRILAILAPCIIITSFLKGYFRQRNVKKSLDEHPDRDCIRKFVEMNGAIKFGEYLRIEIEKLRDEAWREAKKRRNKLDEVLNDTKEMGMVEAFDLASSLLEVEDES